MMKKYVVAFNDEDMVTLYSMYGDWKEIFSILVTQVEEVRNKVQRLELIEEKPAVPDDLIVNEWIRLEYNGKKIVSSFDLRLLRNDFDEGNVYQDEK